MAAALEQAQLPAARNVGDIDGFYRINIVRGDDVGRQGMDGIEAVYRPSGTI